jgi:CHASE1-domain containing sensor protein
MAGGVKVMETHFKSGNKLDRERILIVAVPAVLILIIFVAIFLWIKQWEYTDSLSDFKQLSQQADSQVLNELEDQESLLEQMEGLFLEENNGAVSRQRFNLFVQKSLKRFPMIQAMEWVPEVQDSQRSSFELSQHKDFPNFEIRERNAAKEMQRASVRASYYPVTFVEPLAGNAPAVGFDLASSEQRKIAITKTIQLGSPVITEPITLVQENQKQAGVLLILGIGKTDKS